MICKTPDTDRFSRPRKYGGRTVILTPSSLEGEKGTSVNDPTCTNSLRRAGDVRMGLTNLTYLGGLGGLRFRNTHSPPDTPDQRPGGLAIGVNRHSDKHAPRDFPEAQGAFKVLMIHWILQVARRIAFRCVLHRSGSQDIRR